MSTGNLGMECEGSRHFWVTPIAENDRCQCLGTTWGDVRSVPIPLPPEPPRDRVVEAVDGDGTVHWSWIGNQGGNRWRNTRSGDLVHFEDIVHEVQALSRYGPVDLSLRSVPAERSGSETSVV